MNSVYLVYDTTLFDITIINTQRNNKKLLEGVLTILARERTKICIQATFEIAGRQEFGEKLMLFWKINSRTKINIKCG